MFVPECNKCNFCYVDNKSCLWFNNEERAIIVHRTYYTCKNTLVLLSIVTVQCCLLILIMTNSITVTEYSVNH